MRTAVDYAGPPCTASRPRTHLPRSGSTGCRVWCVALPTRGASAHPAVACAIVIEVGTRKRNQPAPPHVVFEALTQPDRDPFRPWLRLLYDEQAPRVVRAQAPFRVTWSSLWSKQPDALVEFELVPGGGGTDLRWTLF